jgi:predicted RNase H-like nuclease (RuvC/YqgF family)
MSETRAKIYRSPVGKLVSFFARSRDGWKQKHHEAKAKCKKLSNQVQAVEKSRLRWRQRAEEQKRRVRKLEQELEKLKRCVD